ncbi:MAG: hypothetical protein D3910_11425 [Candidatus Electrothrix sp. ATG2]|nr:hypothetical protein [Candidatus Electrothrix sp. ATG2]
MTKSDFLFFCESKRLSMRKGVKTNRQLRFVRIFYIRRYFVKGKKKGGRKKIREKELSRDKKMTKNDFFIFYEYRWLNVEKGQ